ncbi:MAG: 2'-5' RNA ligase family protein [Flavobacteriales bacterium]|nr:2'-5' RNA ligase family protein [Flavobacteriales bacterium]
MNEIRKQLTLFIEESNVNIEKIRAEFNPEQHNLISAHITLCREDEIESIDKIIQRIKSITLKKPIRIGFKSVERFADEKGILIPATDKNIEFRELRKFVLGQTKLTKEQFPHITLMHPRNSTCTDEIFEEIKKQELPTELLFDRISLIEQKNGGKWKVIKEFNIVKNIVQHRL